MVLFRVVNSGFVIFLLGMLFGLFDVSIETHMPIPTGCEGCTFNDDFCTCELEISYGLSSMLGHQLVRPFNGGLQFLNRTNLTQEQASKVISTDGVLPELIITINGQFPGPNIVVYEGQNVTITVVNRMHTDSTTVHWHGIHQRGTPIMDGVSMISQCPIAPDQNFTYVFNAFPHGTNFYHAHIGDQRSMGLYGGFIVKPKEETVQVDGEFVVLLQDWNHDLDPETAYYTMLSEQYNLNTENVIPTTFSQDGANFSRFHFQSGLVNGKGRYYHSSTAQNGSPLEVFNITFGKHYRFRIISAATLYPFEVRIEMHKLRLIASDGFYFQPKVVDSFVIHPGERYDFILFASFPVATKEQYLLVAETLEVEVGNEYHAAEAIINYRTSGLIDINPPKANGANCTVKTPCIVFNCPFPKFPASLGKTCIDFNAVYNNDTLADEKSISGVPDKELFLNFAFPGPKGNTPGSVNGRQFVFPSLPVLTQMDRLKTKCDPKLCTPDSICSCTYVEELGHGDLVQLVLTNVGKGSGWSHPVHIHGHAMYIMVIGFGSFEPLSGKITGDNDQIECQNPSHYCNDANWKNGSVSFEQRYEDENQHNYGYPQKDTIIVPTGGYVVVRFRADNPGAWFLHCHIDLHNTNGMAMVIMEGKDKLPATPDRFPICWGPEQNKKDDDCPSETEKYIIGGACGIGLSLVIAVVVSCIVYKQSRRRDYENI